MFKILAAKNTDTPPVELLLDTAFGPDRHTKRSYHFRAGVGDVPTLRFVANSDGVLCGTIQFWPVTIANSTPALLLGPLGVATDHQNMGVGADLMAFGMNAARDQGHGIVLLVGKLEYYGRFGFGVAGSHGIAMPGELSHRLLIRELHNDALNGVSGPVTSLARPSESAA